MNEIKHMSAVNYMFITEVSLACFLFIISDRLIS